DSDAPILDHPLHQPSAFTAEALLEGHRRIRAIPGGPIPAVCILEFDGDLTDWLVREGMAVPCPYWACFHTTMFVLELGGIHCGIIARTIGGPYADGSRDDPTVDAAKFEHKHCGVKTSPIGARDSHAFANKPVGQ